MTRAIGILALAFAVGGVGCSSNNWNHAQDPANNDMSSNNMSNNDMSGTTGRPADKGAKGLASANDKMFVTDAGTGGMYEVQAGKLAQTNSNDSNVKSIAQQMVEDHTAANNALAVIARQKGIRMPASLTSDQKQMISRLKVLNGTQFDREYLTQQAQAHQSTIAMFQSESTDGTDAALRAFATNTLPTLQHHLQLIKGAEGNVQGMSNNK